MTAVRQPPIDSGAPGVRVRTLITIRWIAIFGQLIAIAVVAGFLGFPLPLGPALTAIGASALLNIGLVALYPGKTYLSGRQATLQLAFDLSQLAALLYLTGGIDNPFAVLTLVPVTISATLLSRRSTVSLLLLAIGYLTALSLWALPLPWGIADFGLPGLYRVGVWIALGVSMGFLAAYVWQVSAEGRRRQQALVATQGALAREQKMSALGSLAAAAAHELGGPLGTITLIASELEEQLGNDPDFGDDIRLLRQEARRSRDILVGIARRAEAEEPFPRLAIPALVHEVVRPFEGGTTRFDIASDASARDLTVERSPELLHGLQNFIANAVRHAESLVRIGITSDGRMIDIIIADDGPGFPEELLPHLGEPYLGPSHSGSGSTGLGIFISVTLLERLGGEVRFANGAHGGAEVDIRLPRPKLG